MKKTLLSSLILVMLAQIPVTVFAQCNPGIPSTANVVSFSQTVNGGFTPQWVCGGDTLYSGGGVFFVYLEAGGVMNTGGGIDTLYMKDGAVLEMNGGIHVIYFEPLAILNVAGGIPTYNPCSTITFDYTNAPTSGCLITSAPDENAGSMSVSISPNPVITQLTIGSSKFKVQRVEIYDMPGQRVLNFELSTLNFEPTTIDVSELTSGIYFVKVNSGKEERVAKFVKE